MSRPSLSLCVIFKDEVPYLGHAIESVISIVDECVLVDSGSSDGSEKIVFEFQKLFPQKKIEYIVNAWPGDFSTQRNFAIEKATSDWILFLDADERIQSQDHATLLNALTNSDIQAYLLPIYNYTQDFQEIGFQKTSTQQEGFILTKLHRLFRRDGRIRYSGILHERIEPALRLIHAKTCPLSVIIHHYGKLKAKTKHLEAKRYSFYEELGRKKVQAEMSDPQAHWELGVVLQKQQRFSEAEAEFKRALSLAPDTEEFEMYWLLSLFQQMKWTDLLQSQPRYPKSTFFKKLAEAQTDPKVVDSLDGFRNDFAQAALMIFELSLRHNRTDRIASDRNRANELFKSTGYVEFIEGSFLRSQKNWAIAIPLLRLTFQKGCPLALHDLLLALTQNQEYREALQVYDDLQEDQRQFLSNDSLKVIEFAKMQMRQTS